MMRHAGLEEGFSLPELIVTMAIMLVVSGAAITALLKMGTTQATIWNRTQMHSGIRGATEVLQQEVGQAGRVSLPAAATLAAAASTGPQTVAVSSAAGMFVGEKLTVDAGCYDTATPCTSRQEVVTLTAVNTSTNTITAEFGKDHAAGTSLQALGGFHAGIVPASATNGSTASVLKLFGDVNGDGNMVYVEYSVAPACICAGTCPAIGNLYRNSMAWDAASKTTASASQVLLGNVIANPNGAACFTYQTTAPVSGRNYVTDVAITLTVQTQLIDPVTKAYQKETKALLNVTPRNVYHTWQLASLGYGDRVQNTPPSITALLAGTGF